MITIQRRGMIVGAALLAAGTTLGLNLLLRRKHYPPTPYDDVLGKLADRDWAEKFGAQTMTADFRAETAAARLRSLLGSGDLESAALREAQQGRLVEAAKWLVPESVALMAMLSAKVKQI
jgi:hypothetical protein